MTLEDQAVCEAALEENMKRRDLNVLEKATAFKGYVDRFGCTIEELGKRLSLDRSTVSNMMRLLELPEAVKALLLEEKITAGHAKAMLALEERHQLALCERIQNERLSVRETEAAVRQMMQQDPEVPETLSFEDAQKKSKTEPAQPTAHVQSLEQQFRDLLGLKVSIKLKTKDSGQVVIEFSSNDDFERLTRLLRKVA
jgi:ParB family chromosome partitioning protein